MLGTRPRGRPLQPDPSGTQVAGHHGSDEQHNVRICPDHNPQAAFKASDRGHGGSGCRTATPKPGGTFWPRARLIPQKRDVFCKLVPFWQIQLYFGEVLGQTPELREDKGGFYPDVFEYVRTSPDLGTAGEQQTEFVLTCSKASGHNLLDFFTKWGFLTPVDASIDDYGSGRMTVTESRIEEIRQRVEALGLPKPDSPIEYITDNNKGLFKTRPEVIPGSVSVSSSGTVTLTDWKNVVVFEVRDADGGLVLASEGKLAPSSKAVFSVPGGWNPSYRLMAVSATGKRTDVTP